MNVIVTWDGDKIGRMVGRARLADEIEEVRKVGQAIDAGNRAMKAWVENNGGSLIEMGGDEGSAELPASKLSELPKIRAQYASAVGSTVSVGVGTKMSEADRALIAAKLQGGDRIILYTPEVDDIIEKLKKEQSEAEKLSEAYLQPMEKSWKPTVIPGGGGQPQEPQAPDYLQGLEPIDGMPDTIHSPPSVDSAVWRQTSGIRGKKDHLQKLGAIYLGVGTGPSREIHFRGTLDQARGAAQAGQVKFLGYDPRYFDPLRELVPDAPHSYTWALHPHPAGTEIRGYQDPKPQTPFEARRWERERDELVTKIREAGRAMNKPKLAVVPDPIDKAELSGKTRQPQVSEPQDSESGLAKAQPGANDGAHAGFSGAMRPAAPTIQKPKAEGSEHSQGEAALGVAEDAPPPPEATNSASQFEDEFHRAAAEQEGRDGGQPPAPSQDQLRAQVVQVLQALKQQMPVLEQVKQSAPETYQAVMQLTQAVIVMARQMNGDNPGQQGARETSDRAASNAQIEIPLPPEEGEEEESKGEDTKKSEVTFESESEKIKENRKSGKAAKPHDFKAAQWTHSNGHPRCIICGDEERTDGKCRPNLEKAIKSRFTEAAFLHKPTGKVITTGYRHDLDHPDVDMKAFGRGEYEDGFVDRQGKFYDRAQALATVKEKKPNLQLPTEELHSDDLDLPLGGKGTWDPVAQAFRKGEIDLQKMAIKDIQPSENGDYSHMLTPEHRAAGYGLTVSPQDRVKNGNTEKWLRAEVTIDGQPVGGVAGQIHGDRLAIATGLITEAARGQGLGSAAYEALYGHAFHVHGVRQVYGDIHSSMASRVHEKVSGKHGLTYKPSANNSYNEDLDGDDGDTDNRFGPYHYALKAEKTWRSNDGGAVPSANHPDRKAWDRKYGQQVKQTFGHMGELRRVRVKMDQLAHMSSGNVVRAKPRLGMYQRMLAAGDRLPPLVIRRNGQMFDIIDGSHRVAAALSRGLDHHVFDAYELTPKTGLVRKAEDEEKDNWHNCEEHGHCWGTEDTKDFCLLCGETQEELQDDLKKADEDLGGESASAGPRPSHPGGEHVRKALDAMHAEIDHRYNHIHHHAAQQGIDPDDYDTSDHSMVPEHCARCQAFPIEQDEIGRCTSTAATLAKQLGGKVVGYKEAPAAGAQVGEGDGEGGHDFALIGGRYIADWWANSYYGHPDLHDTQDPKQQDTIQQLYGDPKHWVTSYDFEADPNLAHYWEKESPLGKASLATNRAPAQRHHVMLPVGSKKDPGPTAGTREAGKQKVLHPETGKQGWISARAGQVLSEDGHAISARNPKGK